MITSKPNRPNKPKDTTAGRRRDSTKHQAILQATRELVEENGYRGLSIKAVASRAKVSRNVLYNWWDGDIARIAQEALLPNVKQWETPNHGNFKQDIEAFLELTIEAVNKPHVLKGFILLTAEAVNDKDELTQTTRYFRTPYARMLGQIINQAEQRNEVASDLDPKHLAQVISGSVLQFAISKNPGRRNAKTVLSELIQKIASK